MDVAVALAEVVQEAEAVEGAEEEDAEEGSRHEMIIQRLRMIFDRLTATDIARSTSRSKIAMKEVEYGPTSSAPASPARQHIMVLWPREAQYLCCFGRQLGSIAA